MRQTLSKRVVLVTGAGRGIGRGIALASAARGASVVVTALDQAEAAAVVAEIAETNGIGAPCVCDVTQRSDVEGATAFAASTFGRLDAVVHNATSRFSPLSAAIDDIAEQQWDDLVAVSLRGTFLLAQASLESLEQAKGAFLVLTSNAALHGAPDLPAYAAVKGAQRGLVKSLAREWGPLGVRVNALSPLAATPALVRYLELYPEARQPLLDQSALRRFGDPENDIGAAATFLIGPDSAFVTGQTLVVDGGGQMP